MEAARGGQDRPFSAVRASDQREQRGGGGPRERKERTRRLSGALLPTDADTSDQERTLRRRNRERADRLARQRATRQRTVRTIRQRTDRSRRARRSRNGE